MGLLLSTTPIIFCDMDGFLVNSFIHGIEALNKEFKTTYTVHDSTYYDWMYDKVNELCNGCMTRQEITALLFGDEVLRKAEPMPGAQEFVRGAYDEGRRRVMIVTSRSVKQYEVTCESQEKYFPEIEQIFMRLPMHCGKLETKYETLIEFPTTLAMFDDDADLILQVSKWVSNDIHFGVIDAPANQKPKDTLGKDVKIPRDGERIRRFGDHRVFETQPNAWAKSALNWIKEIEKKR